MRDAADVPRAKMTADQKRVRLELEKDRRRKDREKLKALAQHVKHARKLRGARMREVLTACRQARTRLRAKRQALRARYELDIAAAKERERLASRRNCDAQKQRARTKHVDSVRRAAGALEAERAHQRQARVWANPTRFQAGPQSSARVSRAGDSLRESDSEVENNLPEDLIRVWRAVRTRIKGTARRSRTEAFLEWVQEHRGEVQRIVDSQIEREVEELVRNEAELRRWVASPSHYHKMSEAELRDDVPF